MTTSTQKHIELIFPDNAHPGDLQIVEKATYDAPGQARLGAARVEPISLASGPNGASRVMSANGGAFIGVISAGEPMPPYNFSYWLVEVEAEAIPSEEAVRD